MSLKAKLTLVFTLIIVVIAAASLIFMGYLNSANEAQTSEAFLESMAEDMDEALFLEDDQLWFYGSTDVPQYLDDTWLLIYDDQENLVSGTDITGGQVLDQSQNGYYTVKSDAGSIYYCYEFPLWNVQRRGADHDGSKEPKGNASGELASGEIASGELASGEPTADVTASDEPVIYHVRLVLAGGKSAPMFKAALILLPVLVVLAALGGWMMAKRALEPMKAITASARDISGGEDLSRRIDIGRGKDEVHELADTFNGMLDRLEKSFQTERQFTSDASHELRTPTAVILAECETALKTAQTTQDYKESVESIQRQGRKMASLVGKLLTFTRRELGTEKAALEEVDLTDLTQAVCEEQAMIARQGIEVKTDLQPDVIALADMDLIMSLIQNLVSNACKYGRENGHVYVTLRAADGKVSLAVKDDGIGIPADKLPKVFDRFYQADPSRTNRDGSLGLGLAMAQQIAHMHGGVITVESTEGEGSTFTLTMPEHGTV